MASEDRVRRYAIRFCRSALLGTLTLRLLKAPLIAIRMAISRIGPAARLLRRTLLGIPWPIELAHG